MYVVTIQTDQVWKNIQHNFYTWQTYSQCHTKMRKQSVSFHIWIQIYLLFQYITSAKAMMKYVYEEKKLSLFANDTIHKKPRLYQKSHRIGKYNKAQDTRNIKSIIFIYELITCILWELHLTVMQTQLSSFQWIFPSNPLPFHCVSLRYQDTLSTWDPAAIPGWD